jgi:2-oxoglutarate/2-oxoacid ferredoxin oxidoreductase subunit alpha
VVGWGSIKGAILDATNKLIEEGKMIRFVQLHLLHPFPSRRVKALIDGYKLLVDIEMNYSSQLASLINENLRIRMDYLISKYNGRPISSSEIYNAIVRIFSGNAPRRIVLERGA